MPRQRRAVGAAKTANCAVAVFYRALSLTVSEIKNRHRAKPLQKRRFGQEKA